MTQPHQSAKGVIKVKLLRAGRVLRSYKVQSDTFTIGAAPGSTIRAAGDPGVKPTHATLYIDEGEITLVPEAGAVVLLNGEDVDFAVPSPSDVIKIGKLSLQVELAGSLESVPPSSASAQPPAKPSVSPRRSHPPVGKQPQSAAVHAVPEIEKPPFKRIEEAPDSDAAPPPAHSSAHSRATKETKPVGPIARSVPAPKKEAIPKAAAPVPIPSRPPKKPVSKPGPSPLPTPSAPPALKEPAKPSASPLPTPSAPPALKEPAKPSVSPVPTPSTPPTLKEPAKPSASPVPTPSTPPALKEKVAVAPVADPDSSSDIPLFKEDEISLKFELDAETALFKKSSQDVAIARSKRDDHDTVPDMSPVPEPAAPQITPDIAPVKEAAPPATPSPSPPPLSEPQTSFSEMDADYFFGEEDEESFVEPFSLADALLSEKKVVKTDGPQEPYSVAHVIRVVNDMVADAFGVVPDTPYTTIDGELKCYIVEDKKSKTSRLILETGPTISGEIFIRNEKKILDGTPSFKVELKDGDNALLQGRGGTYKIEVYRPPLAPKKGQLFSISYSMMAIVIVIALALHGAAAYALRYIDLDRVGDISKEEEEVFAEVIMQQPDKPKPKEEQVVQEEVSQDAKAIAERAPKVSQRTIKKRIKRTSQKQQVSSLLSVLSRGSGKAGKSNKLKDLISNIDAVKSKGGGSGFSIAGAIASLPGKGVNIARSGGGGAISTLSGEQVAGKGSGLASLGKGKRKGKVRGKVTKMSSSAKIGGSLSREDVLRVINKNIHAIQACYERALMGNPSLSGRVAMDWTVATTGRVKSVRVRSSTVGSPKVASCISGVIKRWKFPRPKGGDANITFPFLFRSGS